MRLAHVLVAGAMAIVCAEAASAAPILPTIPTGPVALKLTSVGVGATYTVSGPASGATAVEGLPQNLYPGVPATGTGGVLSHRYFSSDGTTSYYLKGSSTWYDDVNLTVLHAGSGAKPANVEDGWAVFKVTAIYDSWTQQDPAHQVFIDPGTEIVGIMVGQQDVALGLGGTVLSSGYQDIQLFAQTFNTFKPNQGTAGRTGFNTYTTIGGTGSVLLADLRGLAKNSGGDSANIGASPDDFGLGVGVIPPGIGFAQYHGLAGAGGFVVQGAGPVGTWQDGDPANGEMPLTTFSDVSVDTGPVTAGARIDSTLSAYSGPANWQYASSDPTVRLNFSATPEPATLSLLALGGLAMIGRMARRAGRVRRSPAPRRRRKVE